MNTAITKQECKNKGCLKTARVRGYCQRCYGLLRYHRKLDLKEEEYVRRVNANSKSREAERGCVIRSYIKARICYRLAVGLVAQREWRAQMEMITLCAAEVQMTAEELKIAADELLADAKKKGYIDGRDEG